ncbi:hypothetical protein ABCS02_11770 [Microbacterium sp. X-17]|uniref:hypothetical protein n=1 Tax=Microbacterium sp. X-17 TaxID=3144404 RepID=UPI0031F58F83
MVVQTPAVVSGRTPKPVQIPTRSPWTPPPRRRPLHADCLRVDADRYEVRFGGRVVGFIEIVGPVYVVLAGARRDRAVEIAQSLLFDMAVATLEMQARGD